jgi:hypothetical protein
MAAKRAVAAPRRATDKRTVGTAKNPKVVQAPSAAAYRAPKPVKVVKKSAGRPKKAK